MIYLYSLQSEWLKTRRSAASWLCLAGGFFIPLMFFFGFLKEQASINQLKSPGIWQTYFFQVWKFMATALLPLGVIMVSSLIAQLEYRNNTWKQLHTTPQSFAVIFLAKLSAIVLMTLKFFLFFNIGILVSAIVPALLFDHKLPREPLPVLFFLKANGTIFLTCLPVIALQYLLSLRLRNFLAPIGIGILMLIGSLILINTWRYAYLSPYSYSPLVIVGDNKSLDGLDIRWLSLGYFALITAVAYGVYRMRNEKG